MIDFNSLDKAELVRRLEQAARLVTAHVANGEESIALPMSKVLTILEARKVDLPGKRNPMARSYKQTHEFSKITPRVINGIRDER